MRKGNFDTVETETPSDELFEQGEELEVEAIEEDAAATDDASALSLEKERERKQRQHENNWRQRLNDYLAAKEICDWLGDDIEAEEGNRRTSLEKVIENLKEGDEEVERKAPTKRSRRRPAMSRGYSNDNEW